MRASFTSALVFLLAVGVLTGCDQHTDPPTLADVPPERLIAFTAVFAETGYGDAPVQRIIVADFENPSVFEVLTPNDHASVQPYLSRDRRQVLFGDRTTGAVNAPQLVRYDLRTGAADTLGHVPPGSPPPEEFDPLLIAPTWPILWDRDDGGFLFTNPRPPFSAKQDVLHFGFSEGYFERVVDAGPYSTMALGLKGPDTLLVFSNSPEAPGYTVERPAGIYYMSSDGRFLGPVENPHLWYVFEGTRSVQQILEPTWNETEKLFAYRLVRPNGNPHTRNPSSIAVSDFTGAYFRAYTLDDQYVYTFPRWGPEGKLLLNVSPYGSPYWQDHRVMVLDLDTGSLREWAEPSTFGAVGMRFPNMGEH